MSYTSHSLFIDSAAIAVAKQTLEQLIEDNADQLAAYSLADAIAWLEDQMPPLRDVVSLLTWANAVEQIVPTLSPNSDLWKQALQTEAYSLRLRAQTAPRNTGE